MFSYHQNATRKRKMIFDNLHNGQIAIETLDKKAEKKAMGV